MKKNILLTGLALIVVGICLLILTGLPEQFEYKLNQENNDIAAGQNISFMFDVKNGTRLDFSFSMSFG